jgi:hypothetical protein
MIKLTTTQAKAVACKIRERLMEHNEQVRNALRKEYKESDDYKNKRREIHELVVTAWQTHLKTGLDYGIGISRYGSQWLFNEKDVEKAEEHISEGLVAKYVNEKDTTKLVPDEDTLVTDLIFESLTSEGIEDLMNIFIEKYS